MVEAITATYVEHDDDWSVTVTGMGEELTEHAPGIIAARDQADQLIESLKPDDGETETVVVHLLHGSALEFTTAYMTARLSRTTDLDTTEVPQDIDAESGESADSEQPQPIPTQVTGEYAQDADDVEDTAAEDDAEPAASSAK